MKEKEGNCESLGFVWFFCSISLISSRVSDATENRRNRRSQVTERISGCGYFFSLLVTNAKFSFYFRSVRTLLCLFVCFFKVCAHHGKSLDLPALLQVTLERHCQSSPRSPGLLPAQPLIFSLTSFESKMTVTTISFCGRNSLM